MIENMRQAASKFKGAASSFVKDYLDLGTTRGRLFAGVAVLGLVFVWFMPWVLTVPLGTSLYLTYEPDGSGRSLALTGPVPGALGLADWVPADRLPRACRAAVVAAEDTLFYEHRGLDTASIEKAWNDRQQRRGEPRPARGASTITQQLVKNLYLSRDRSYLRKVREAAGALALELVASKDTILTWYLNVVEFGPNVYGLSAAARHYFKKPAESLRPHECVALAVILPSPNKWNTSLVTRRYSSFFVRRYAVIARRMAILSQVDSVALRDVRTGAPFFFEVPSDEATDAEALSLPEPPPQIQGPGSGDGGELAGEAVDSASADSDEAGPADVTIPETPQPSPSPSAESGQGQDGAPEDGGGPDAQGSGPSSQEPGEARP